MSITTERILHHDACTCEACLAALRHAEIINLLKLISEAVITIAAEVESKKQ